MKHYTRVLTIAGSDSSGGAGIQADLKTISACGCYGMSAITAVTVQDTQGVRDIHPVPAEIVAGQIRAVLDDSGVDGIKIGMLYSPEVIERVAKVLSAYPGIPIVLDPVTVATSGDPLHRGDMMQAMTKRLFPLIRLLTPNIPETECLLGEAVGADPAAAAERLAKRIGCSVLIKGGHRQTDELVDVLYDVQTARVSSFAHPRIDTPNTHGTGCTLASAITSFLAKGHALEEAVDRAQEYLQKAIISGSAYRIGRGNGPLHHFHLFWQ